MENVVISKLNLMFHFITDNYFTGFSIACIIMAVFCGIYIGLILHNEEIIPNLFAAILLTIAVSSIWPLVVAAVIIIICLGLPIYAIYGIVRIISKITKNHETRNQFGSYSLPYCCNGKSTSTNFMIRKQSRSYDQQCYLKQN